MNITFSPIERQTARSAGLLRAVTAITLVASYLLVVLGDTVRVTDSGMGCASWPLCNGSAGLPGGFHAFMEQSHRYLAAVVTIAVLAMFALAWRQTRDNRLVYLAAVASVVLIGVMVALGAVTVFAHNAGWTVALHLAGAWLLLAAVTVATLGVWRRDSDSVRPAGSYGTAAVAVLFVLSVSGMLVLHANAATACPGFPTCGTGTGSVAAVTIQYLHRTLAVVAAITVIVAAIRAWRSAAATRADRIFAVAAVALLAGTATIGAIVATTGATRWPQDLHLAVASLFWVAVVALAVPHVAPGRPGTGNSAAGEPAVGAMSAG